MIKLILNEAGYEVWDADNGLEASKMSEQRLPDLLITDLLMPEKEGMELIQEVCTRYSQIPIIAISGVQTAPPELYLRMAKSLGAPFYLATPFLPDDHLQMVKQALS